VCSGSYRAGPGRASAAAFCLSRPRRCVSYGSPAADERCRDRRWLALRAGRRRGGRGPGRHRRQGADGQANVENLSVQLADRLVDELQGTLPNLKRASQAPAGQEVDDLKRTSLRPLVLDVRGAGTIIYYASNFARYRLRYAGRARLVDTEAGRVLWQGTCDFRGTDDPAQSPTLGELEAADGGAYRRLITDATALCATELLKQFRGEGRV